MDNRPIGIFDSGVGGLTVAREVIDLLGNEQIIYFGDTARVPYGDKSKDIITKYSVQDVNFLLTKGVKAVIVACNTASSNSLDILKQKFDIPIFGVVIPGSKGAINATKNKKIGVIGTKSTIRSDAYRNLILNEDSSMKVFSKACPLFVPIVEEGFSDEPIAKIVAEKYLKELIDENIDTLVLGCTHYPFLKNCIKEVVGYGITLVDPANQTAYIVKEYLEYKDMLNKNSEKNDHIFYVSDKTDTFKEICHKALNKTYSAKEINIESF